MTNVHDKQDVMRSFAGLSTSLCVVLLFSSCGQQTSVPPKPPEFATPTAVLPENQGSLVLVTSQGVSHVQSPGECGTGTLAAATISVSDQILALRSEIVDIAGRRGAVAGQLSELRRNAMLRDNVGIKAIDSEIRARRDALLSKLNELPEVVAMKKAVDETENRKKELLAQRVVISERRIRPGTEDGSSPDSAEQLKVIDSSLNALQKELQTSLAGHRKLVQQAREKSLEINTLLTEIGEKEAARVKAVDSLPGIKELAAEQAGLEFRLRDLKIKLRLLSNSESQSRDLPEMTNTLMAMPK